jgi:L-ascorbate metabolism protein UlaG (beta-lactamase superfamily)
MDITLVANAGVLVEHDGVGLLVDGIHHQEGHPFSKVSEIDMERMRQGAEPFSNLDYLLFTHEHPDHLTPRHVLELVRSRQIRKLFLPDERQGSKDLLLLLEHARKQGVSYETLGLDPGTTRQFQLTQHLTITAIGSRHMGPQYQSVRNDCFLLSWKGMNILFTGDGDHVAEYYENALKDVVLDVVFVNPIFYHNMNGQEVINAIFRPRHVIIYHMPFVEEDTMQFHYMVNRDMEKYGDHGPWVHVMGSRNQHLCLHPSP